MSFARFGVSFFRPSYFSVLRTSFGEKTGLRKLTSGGYWMGSRACSTGTDQVKAWREMFDLRFEDEIAVLQMKTGENRMHPTFMENFHHALSEVESNSDCRALITTGEGKFYSNGLDLDYAAQFDRHEMAEYLQVFSELVVRILTFPMPTVAAINGHAFAGGAVVAMGQDLRVMRSGQGWICWNEVAVSVRFPPPLLELMRIKLEPGHVQTQAVIFGKRFTAEKAKDAGIVDRISDPARLLDDAKQLAIQALGKEGFNRDTLQIFKRDLYKSVVDLCEKSTTR